MGEVVLHALVLVLKAIGHFLAQAIVEIVWESISYGTGRLLLAKITGGRVRAQGLSEPDPGPPDKKWRDANGTVIYSIYGTALIGLLFWLSVLALYAVAFEVFVRNPG